jgi:hypothetical protein
MSGYIQGTRDRRALNTANLPCMNSEVLPVMGNYVLKLGPAVTDSEVQDTQYCISDRKPWQKGYHAQSSVIGVHGLGFRV